MYKEHLDKYNGDGEYWMWDVQVGRAEESNGGKIWTSVFEQQFKKTVEKNLLKD